MCPGGAGEGQGFRFSMIKDVSEMGKKAGENIVLLAINIPIFVGSQPHAWLGDDNLRVANMAL